MFTLTILRFDSIDSTNLEAMRQAKAGAAEGLCVIAREQTRGRGRLDRSWYSPKDAGLYLSVILRPSFEIGRWPLIGLAAALAVFDALENACDLRADIKWPNDIVVNDRKLAGILAETVETPDGGAVVLGIGINLASKNLPVELSESATSITAMNNSRPIDRESVIAELIKSLSRRYQTLYTDDGCHQTIHEWCANSSYGFDREVRVVLANESFEGVTRGLEWDGALRVETSEGAVRIVRAGDVRAVRPARIVTLINEQ
jgi:BirA family transcriptional regulator, biotin operon repressor / biotin---[acetyl-CoA-carboxylase] ligase